MKRLRPLFALLILSFLGSCVSFRWEREQRFAPLPQAAVDSLEIGEDGLQVVLDRLGAPVAVQELSGGAMALVYGWDHTRRLGFNVNIPITSEVSGSVDYTDARRETPGLVATFDGGWTLVDVRSGLLGELAREPKRVRPVVLESRDSAIAD